MTLGPEVAAVSTSAGYAPDPEQRILLDGSFGVDRFGKPTAFTVVVLAPRQNLKTGFLKQYALGQMFVVTQHLPKRVAREWKMVWSAHEFATAEGALDDMEALIEDCDDLARLVKRTSRNKIAKHGAIPVIELTNGAKIIFKTRTKGGGRGLSGNKTILDEAYAVQPGQAGALLPIMLARPGAQVLWASSACRPESAVLWDQVVRGRPGAARVLYAEWCAPPASAVCRLGEKCMHERSARGCGCDNLDLIKTIHSAVKRGRIEPQTLIDLRGDIPPSEYGREILGWHDEVAGSAMISSLAHWPAIEDAASQLRDTPAAFAVAVSTDRKWAAIGVAGPAKDAINQTHLELVERKPGVAWVVARCKELAAKYRRVPFVVDDHGPAASLITDLKKARVNVVELKTDDALDATEQFLDGVVEGRFVHGPDEVVDDAIAAVQPRPVGERFAFGRKTSAMDITALEVVAFASYGAANYKRPTYVVDTQALMEAARAEEDVADPENP